MLKDEARIRTRAYEIWEQEGRPDGEHANHWQQALAQLAVEDGKDNQKDPPTSDRLDLGRIAITAPTSSVTQSGAKAGQRKVEKSATRGGRK